MGYGSGTLVCPARRAKEMIASRCQLILENGHDPLVLLALRLAVLLPPLALGLEFLELPVQLLVALLQVPRLSLDLLQSLSKTNNLSLAATLGLLVSGLQSVVDGGQIPMLPARSVGLVTEPLKLVSRRCAVPVDLSLGLDDEVLRSPEFGRGSRLLLAPTPLGLLDEVMPLLLPTISHRLIRDIPAAALVFKFASQGGSRGLVPALVLCHRPFPLIPLHLECFHLNTKTVHLLLKPISVGAGRLPVPALRCGDMQFVLAEGDQRLRFAEFRPEAIDLDPSPGEFLTQRGGQVGLLL